MAYCEVEIEALRGRPSQVRRLLRSISSESGGPACEVRNLNRVYTLCAYGPGKAPEALRDWRFKTPCAGFYGHYEERWRPVAVDRRSYFLERAYLMIYRRLPEPARGESEIIALHCDPNLPEESRSVYKAVPHIHVKAADPPIPRAHLALELSQIDDLLTSHDVLMEAFRRGIDLICEEVLSRYEAA